MVELAFNRGQIFKNIGVVKFQIVQHRCAWAVVHKFAALVKKCGVVFVGFNHEIRALMPRHFAAQPRRNAKIQRHTTY